MRGWSCCRTVTAPLSFLTRGEHSALPNALAGIQISPLRRNSLVMPEDDVTERAREDEREGLSPSTQAGEFVREEMEHIREGKHGARSPQQAIAIGLSKARRAGVKLPPPKRGKKRTKRQAKQDLAKGRKGRRKPSTTRSRAVRGALKRESRSAASRKALSRSGQACSQKSQRSQPVPLGKESGPDTKTPQVINPNSHD